MMERRKALSLTVVLVLLGSTLSYYAGAINLVPRLTAVVTRKAPAQQAAAPTGLDYGRLDLVKKEIEKYYLTPPTADKLTEGALKGMVAATGDKYSAYFNPKEYGQFVDQLKSTLSGIGVYVELSPKTGLITIVSPMKGTPGEKAGLRAGDTIVAVDGKDLHGMKLEQAVDLIRGQEGTTVKLSILRDGADSVQEFVVKRATIEIPTTDAKMLDAANGVGYIQLREFNTDVSKRLLRDMTDLKSQGMTKLILDLRQDPGGLLDEAVNVASIFVPKGTPVLFVEGRDSNQTYTSKGAKEKFDMPLVVLVDGGSASAAEILAGALKDLKIGTLLGVKTFGKGSVQTFHDLPDGAGIKLTIAHYLTAGKNSINEKGIDPDIVKENPKDILPGDPGDVQLSEALKYIQTLKR